MHAMKSCGIIKVRIHTAVSEDRLKIIAPDYYPEFHCIADQCRHTCCQGWEIDIDEASMRRFAAVPEIRNEIDFTGEVPHFRLSADERCPFLREDGLCRMIKTYGEGMLCQICADHPRFRNYWSDRIELGLGMVCEEAARLILSRERPARLILIDENDDESAPLTEVEQQLMDYRQYFTERAVSELKLTGPRARLMEYLIYRHIPDALYDDQLENRAAFILSFYREITSAWDKTDGSLDAYVEAVRQLSYDVEYDDDVLRERIARGS